MITYHFKNKEEFYDRMRNGTVQDSIMSYLKKSEEIELPVTEDTLLYNFEAEFEVELENGKRCISDEDIVNPKDNLASLFHDVIIATWNRYQNKESKEELGQITGQKATILHHDADILIWRPFGTWEHRLEYIFVDHKLLICHNEDVVSFTFPWKPKWNDDWTKLTKYDLANYLTEKSIEDRYYDYLQEQEKRLNPIIAWFLEGLQTACKQNTSPYDAVK